MTVSASAPVSTICIDGRLLHEARSGVSHYAARLAGTLTRYGSPPLQLDSQAPAGSIASARGSDPRRVLHALRPWPRFARTVLTPHGERLIGSDLFREAYLHFKFTGRLMPVRCDRAPGIMHWTYPVPLIMRGWRNVYTVHDLIPLQEASLSPVRPARIGRLIAAIARRADRIVTVTDAVRDEVIAAFGCPPALVVNSLQSVDCERPADGAPLGADAPFIFCGSIEPRKNLERLAQAYRRSGSARPLLIVGEDGWRADDVRAAIGAVAGIRFMPFQGRAALLELMARARALLFPSLAEGFGLPVAEAMTLGTPVMTSNLPALREVAGGAALLVDPLDIDAMARAIRRLDEDDGLRAALQQQGWAKAVDYAPAAYYERLQRIYADVERHPRSASGKGL
ncbi:glycosyltransferase family 1 protein [Sphingobium sp. AN641]|uniref:glycosyltransferase family 4 protein n=1 Tax=Sphingobium sp. AN641 TaxID=3133443 RepID=UPI0030C309B1